MTTRQRTGASTATIANIEFADGTHDSLKGTFTEESYGLVYYAETFRADRVVFPWHTLKKVVMKS